MLDQIRKALHDAKYPFEDRGDHLVVGYESDIASLKLADGIYLGNGSDGYHNIIIKETHKDVISGVDTGTYIKLDRFAFYKYDCDDEPLFTVEGFTMVTEKLGRSGYHSHFEVKV